MKLLFEGNQYNRILLSECFGEKNYKQFSKNNSKSPDTVMLDCVGYFYNSKQDEPIYLLPKVFNYSDDNSKNTSAFGFMEVKPNEAIVINEENINSYNFDDWHKEIIFTLPVWIYKSIEKYRVRQQGKSNIEETADMQSLLSSKLENGESTLLDIAESLVRFYKENKSLFLFTYKESHSGFNKINWNKTIRKSMPYVQGKDVIYLDVCNKKKTINFDEELIVIFFNTLQYLKKYHYYIKIDQPYNLEPESVFASKTESGAIRQRLLRIKKNYFSDKMLQLWKILYIFHNKKYNRRSSKLQEDYLLIKDYNLVFEDMIDELLGDEDIPKDLIYQEDGKIVDHILKHDSLAPTDKEMYYVGDSKYYKDTTEVRGTALYKQYTYVKNIIQAHFNWYNQPKKNKVEDVFEKYLDEFTDGYNITPNFFISGMMKTGMKIDESCLKQDDSQNEVIKSKPFYHFENRLFDRDTLFLLQYDINFLFVLNSYVSRDYATKTRFKNDAKEIFRKDFIQLISRKYEFYILDAKSGYSMEYALNKNFRKLIGKVFCPFTNHQHLIMALDKKYNDENDKLRKDIDNEFDVYPWEFGDNIFLEIPKSKPYTIAPEEPNLFNISEPDPILYNVLIGYYKSEEHLKWIQENKMYNVRLGNIEGAVDESNPLVKNAEYLILYNDVSLKKIICYKLTGKNVTFSSKDLIEMGYPGKEKKYDYYVYELKDEPIIINIDKEKILSHKHAKECMVKKAPLYIKMEVNV